MSKTSKRRGKPGPTRDSAASPARPAATPAPAAKPRTGGAPAKPAPAAAAPAGAPPLRLTLAAAVAALEGLVVAAWGIATCFTGGDKAVPAGLLLLLFAAIPLSAAYGLRRARRWSRGPALIMQLLALPIAWTMMGSDGPVIPGGIALGVLAITGIVLLVHPSTTDALGINRTASP